MLSIRVVRLSLSVMSCSVETVTWWKAVFKLEVLNVMPMISNNRVKNTGTTTCSLIDKPLSNWRMVILF
ncbi:hypothetical protein DA89_2705 [Vibrio paracholerae]|nr:hypothetical protein DA89_2705 [Vibrio paracholerae]